VSGIDHLVGAPGDLQAAAAEGYPGLDQPRGGAGRRDDGDPAATDPFHQIPLAVVERLEQLVVLVAGNDHQGIGGQIDGLRRAGVGGVGGQAPGGQFGPPGIVSPGRGLLDQQRVGASARSRSSQTADADQPAHRPAEIRQPLPSQRRQPARSWPDYRV